MACFVCPVFGNRMCDGSCGLGCPDCPGDVEAADDADKFVSTDVWPSTPTEELE